MERTFQKEDYNRQADYNDEIERAKAARVSQKNDTNPYMQKEGYLGVDDLDRLRRRKTY